MLNIIIVFSSMSFPDENAFIKENVGKQRKTLNWFSAYSDCLFTETPCLMSS